MEEAGAEEVQAVVVPAAAGEKSPTLLIKAIDGIVEIDVFVEYFLALAALTSDIFLTESLGWFLRDQ